MADYRSSAAHQLNYWLWQQLKDFVWNGTDKAFAAYGPSAINLVPIIPAQQIPELNDISGGAPFIVYNYRPGPKVDLFLQREKCAYVIYDSNYERATALFNYIVDLLRRYDWSARSVNAGLAPSNYDFKAIWVDTTRSPEPADDAGGRHSAVIMTGYEYTLANDGLEGSGLRV